MWGLKGKVVVVTGAAQGIGFATAKLFAAEGAKVVLVDLETGPNQKAAQVIQKTGASALAISCDVSKSDSVQKMVDTVVQRYSRIDVLHANAAVQITKRADETTEAEWEWIHGVNIKGVFLTCKYVIPVMVKQKEGAVIISSSGHAFATYPNSSAYAATKGAQIAYMRGLALDYAQEGIRVNCVIPGTTDTRLVQRYIEGFADPQAARGKLIESIPLQRLAEPKDVAKAVLFLASDYAGYITGTSLTVDGGLAAKI